MYYSGLQVFSFLVLLVGTGLIIASIPTLNWTRHVFTKVGESEIYSERGLYQECNNLLLGSRTCSNRFEAFMKDQNVDNLQKSFKAWEVATLALMVGSGTLGLLALILSPCCCRRCGFCLVITVLLATLCCAAGVGTFAHYSKAEPTYDKSSVISLDHTYLDWSFWLAVAGGSCQLIATFLFGISSCRRDNSYSHSI